MPTKALRGILLELADVFPRQATFENFAAVVVAWILCTGRRTVSRVIQAMPNRKHHSSIYRFFSRATWTTDKIGRVLLELALSLVPEGAVIAIVDDTLCRKIGGHLWGGGMHHDPLQSNYSPGRKGRLVNFAFGHNWLTLSLWLPLPWTHDRGIALPILFRLYRSKKRCPKGEYRKRTELARELVDLLRAWLGGRRLLVLGDNEYASTEVLRDQPETVSFIGTMNMDAAIYDFPPHWEPGYRKGARPKKGRRLPSPQKIAADPGTEWKKVTVRLYGRDVELLVHARRCLWYRVTRTRPVLVVMTRDPRGRWKDRVYVCTDAVMDPVAVITHVARRWAHEVMHRDVKQHLGLEDPQNGWWRRERRPTTPEPPKPGPNAHATRGEAAVKHTAPVVYTVYSLVVLWYLRRSGATINKDVAWARERARWYRHKTTPSFGDMLGAARRELWGERLIGRSASRGLRREIFAPLIDSLAAA